MSAWSLRGEGSGAAGCSPGGAVMLELGAIQQTAARVARGHIINLVLGTALLTAHTGEAYAPSRLDI